MSKKKAMTTFEAMIAWKLTEGVQAFPSEQSMPLATIIPLISHLARHLAKSLTAEDLVRSGFTRERRFGPKPSRRSANSVDLLRREVQPQEPATKKPD